jgi:hypothetical protein
MKEKDMNAPELLAFMNAQSTITEVALINILIEYFTTSGQEHIGSSLKNLCQRASRGDTTLLSATVVGTIANKRSDYNYVADRTVRR